MPVNETILRGLILKHNDKFDPTVIHNIQATSGSNIFPNRMGVNSLRVEDDDICWDEISSNDKVIYRNRLGISSIDLVVHYDSGKIADRPTSRLILTIQDADTNEPVSGSIYKLTNIQSKKESTFTSDNGTITFNKVEYGANELVQVKPAIGYALDTTPIPVNSDFDTTPEETKVIKVTIKKASIVVENKNSSDGSKLSGTVYTLTDSSNNIINTKTTIANGTATFTNVRPGTYTVNEVTPSEGFVLNNGIETVTLPINPTNVSVTFTSMAVPVEPEPEV